MRDNRRRYLSVQSRRAARKIDPHIHAGCDHASSTERISAFSKSAAISASTFKGRPPLHTISIRNGFAERFPGAGLSVAAVRLMMSRGVV